jgi:hypothetical protein
VYNTTDMVVSEAVLILAGETLHLALDVCYALYLLKDISTIRASCTTHWWEWAGKLRERAVLPWKGEEDGCQWPRGRHQHQAAQGEEREGSPVGGEESGASVGQRKQREKAGDREDVGCREEEGRRDE